MTSMCFLKVQHTQTNRNTSRRFMFMLAVLACLKFPQIMYTIRKKLSLVSILERNLGGRVRKIKINYFKSKGNGTHLVDFNALVPVLCLQGKL